MENRDKKLAGANYIFSFYNGVMSLIDASAHYTNLLIQLEAMYGDQIEVFNEQDKINVANVSNNLRYFCNVTYTQYKAIALNIPQIKDKEKEIDDKYKNIMSNYLPKRGGVSEFVILMNSVLVQDVIKTLLESNQDLLNSMFNPENGNTPK